MAIVDRAGVEFPTDTDGLTRDFASATQSGNTKFTLSFWTEGSGLVYFYNADLSNYHYLYFSGSSVLFEGLTPDYEAYIGYDFPTSFTKPLFIMLSFDSTQAAQEDRVRIWAGLHKEAVSELTLTDLSPTPIGQNDTVLFNESHDIGYAVGTIADVYFLDGIALTDPSNFLDSYSTSAQPINYTGSFGNLGYHLDFADSLNIGNDVSGNNNDFTVSGSPVYVDPYLEETPSSTGKIKVWDGSSFIAKPVKVWNGSSWVIKPVKVWNGSSWTTTNY